MPFELHIALRYLLARRRQAFISVISLISMLGVAVGVSALIIALALDDRAPGRAAQPDPRAGRRTSTCGSSTASPICPPRSPGCAPSPGVVGAAPTIQGKGLVCEREGRRSSSASRASTRRSRASVTDLAKAMVQGTIEAIAQQQGDAAAGNPGWRRSREGAGAARRRFADRAHARGHALADGMDAACAAAPRRRASSGLASMTTTPRRASSRSRSQSG